MASCDIHLTTILDVDAIRSELDVIALNLAFVKFLREETPTFYSAAIGQFTTHPDRDAMVKAAREKYTK
jgi:hypothetical protein